MKLLPVQLRLSKPHKRSDQSRTTSSLVSALRWLRYCLCSELESFCYPQESSSSTPIFGSASTFGAGNGFAGFTGVDTSKTSAAAPQKTDNEDEEDAGNDEECGAEYAPVVQLQEVETSTGEEAETALFDV